MGVMRSKSLVLLKSVFNKHKYELCSSSKLKCMTFLEIFPFVIHHN